MILYKKLLLLSLSDKNNWDFDANIYDPIKNVFAKVIRFEDYRKRFNDVGIRKLQKEIIELVKNEQPYYVLFPASSYKIMEETLQIISAKGYIILGWFFDELMTGFFDSAN